MGYVKIGRLPIIVSADKNSYISVRTFPYKFIYRVAKLAENDITCSLVVCFI